MPPTSYTYDSLNRLSTVVDNNLPAGHNTTTYAYDPASNLATATYPNGLTATYAYDQLNRLSSTAANSTPASGYQYTRDNNGNILTETEGNDPIQNNRTATYTYDGLDQLTSETVANDPANVDGSVGYSLDPVGNRSSLTSTLGDIAGAASTFNADDQPQTESYDANGDTTATGGNTFAYNSWLKLAGMNGGQVALSYNGMGQLVAKTTAAGTTQYLIDDLSPTGYPQVVAELVNGAVARTYTYGYERISQLQYVPAAKAWTPSFYVYDGRGTVRMLADANGQVTDSYTYDAFGNLLAQTGTTPNVYLYRGERWDQDLGLYYLRARWYNPATGRFMSRDPYGGSIWDPASLHRYNYARSNPVNYVDPSGRASVVEIPLGILKDIASAAAVGIAGRQIACLYYAEASMLQLVIAGPAATRQQAEMLRAQLVPHIGFCGADITWKQVAGDTAFNLMFGYALEGAGQAFGKWLQEGAQGFPWRRFATEEEGGIGFGANEAGEGAGAAKGLTNAEVRAWYNEQLTKLDTSGPATEETAARVNAARNALKQQARDMMADRAAAEQLANEQPLQPLQYYIDKYSQLGYQGEALWEKIIERSTVPNEAVNIRFGIE